MRPVLLEMEGFASFRERALVDFEDADYFAIVGPTGSGKSTLVDAMTFALYGSAPRWGRRNAVGMALSPHGNRAVVRLVFELAGQRYVVAREVRRTGASVSTRNQRLERLPSPDSRGEPDENTVVLAADSAVTDEVEKLLGLTFEQFRQCVVLPQNAFAEFLHSTPANRQQILLRLIGAEHYEQIQDLANRRAAAAREQAEHLDRRLTELADATAQAQRSAQDHEAELAGLVDRVRVMLPDLAAAQAAHAAAAAEQERLTGEHERLAAISVPEQAADLDRAVAAAQERAATTDTEQARTEEADTRARERLAAAGDRAPLEQIVADDAELARITTELPHQVRARDDAAQEHTAAVHRATQAELERTRAQSAHEHADRTAELARQQVEDLTARHRLLQAPVLPPGLDDLDRDLSAARNALEVAETHLTGAEKAEESAQQSLEAGPPRDKLERARRTLEQLADVEGRLGAAREQLDAARAVAQRTAATVQERIADLRAVRQRREETRRQHAAAALREHLTAGQDCPVCAQPVAVLPTLDAGPGTDPGAQAAAEAAAETAAEAARAEQTAAARAESAAESSLADLERRATVLRAEIPRACPDLETAQRLLDELEALETGRSAALREMRQARGRTEQCRRALGELTDQESRLRNALGRSRDPLVALGAPAVAELPLAQAWRDLSDWAAARTLEVATELDAARSAGQAADDRKRQSERDLATAADTARAAATARDDALAHLERARVAHDQSADRAEQLRRIRSAGPPVDQARARLAELDDLAQRVRDCDSAVRTAREAARQARAELGALDERLAQGWTQVRRVRDDVVQLGAPELDADGLMTAWNILGEWSRRAAAERREQLTEAAARTRTCREQADSAHRDLLGRLGRYAVTAPEADLAGTALAAATAAHAAAAAALHRIIERRQEAGQVLTERDTAQHTAQVAKLLGDQLRSDKFPRWLATAALEGLVIEASATLLRLSDGRFDLDHDERGELVVVDHADADARRSVKTLSGGETFQASLAMALALSSQMSQLSSAGGARLDSIFLDEGFGTLDPDTLETVAGTLENLARGERMVGVITHVPALADRVPVRFSVRRDAQTSTVERQNL